MTPLTDDARLAARVAALIRADRRAWRHTSARRVGRATLALGLTLLAALLPAALLAAGPTFTDLEQAAPVHRPNILAIGDVGITTGFADPNNPGGRLYAPTQNVTREEMASFLARTAGLGGNPPVANAATAQTAQNAVNAQDTAALGGQPPAFYQPAGQPIANAVTAQSATSAGNAATLGGYAPSDLTRLAFSGTGLTGALPISTNTDLVRVTLTVPGPAAQVVYVRGSINAHGQDDGGFIITTIRQDGMPNNAGSGELLFPYQTTNSGIGVSIFNEWAFVAPPGQHTYTLIARAVGTTGTLTIDDPRLVATTHPFGNTGGTATTGLPDNVAVGGDRPRP